MLQLDRQIAFDPVRAEEFFASVPPRSAVVLIEPRPGLPGARPLLLRTADLRRRLRLLLSPPEANSKRLNLREYAAGIRFRVAGSRFEQALVHWQQARLLWPGNYRDRLHLHPSPFLKLNLANAYPRAYITRRLGATGLYLGPFVSRRAAEAFLESWLDLFRIRRCQIKIRRDPDFPGCIYSEMKMCLAPCFGGCTAAEYADEARRAADYLRSGGASLADVLSGERESASAELNFEQASALHKRLERIHDLQKTLPDIVRPVEKLDAVLLMPAEAESSIAVFQIRGGEITDPFLLEFTDSAAQPRSPEQRLRELLEPIASPSEASDSSPASVKTSLRDLEDHIALLSRWFYAKPREGEIFFHEPAPVGWPYRRILRACRRLLAPPGSEKGDNANGAT